MASRIEKAIARQKEKVAEGQYYEAHQHLRVITARYLSASPPNYKSAIDLLSEGALLLLHAGSNAQPLETTGKDEASASTTGSAGSGGDLCMYLMDVYDKSATPVDAESKGRLLRLLRAFPKGEPTRKRFMGEVTSWAGGDPEIHHVCGQLLASDASGNDIYDAERHLIHGTRDSPAVLASLEQSWYSQDTPDTAPLYCARAVLPYLVAGNLRGATQSHLLFTRKLPDTLRSETVSAGEGKTETEVRVYPSLPLLNFLALLLVAVQRGTGGRDAFKQLCVKYRPYLQEQAGGTWDEALEMVGEIWFGIRRPRPQGNPLMDMMGSMFGGGGGGGGGGRSQSNRAPPVMNVD